MGTIACRFGESSLLGRLLAKVTSDLGRAPVDALVLHLGGPALERGGLGVELLGGVELTLVLLTGGGRFLLGAVGPAGRVVALLPEPTGALDSVLA